MASTQSSLEGKVALISGGSRGIGRATAIAFARAGADVAVASRKLPDLEKVADEVRGLGRKAMALKVDVSDSKQIHAAAREVEENWGRIDILVNNAGLHLVQRFTRGNEDEWERILTVNLKSHIVFCRAVLDGMIERKYGKIINVASDAGRAGSSGQAVYGAAKGGIVAFTRNLAMETARFGLNVNCVSPGMINTAMWNAVREDSPKLAEAYERLLPGKRLGEPEEVAAAILFLATDEAAYITGQTISVNGGVFSA
ncbi:MAG: 3-oxoacyl-ACP reductase FabG [Dehalococcoidia bacterium]|nr:3-oxoacyl-ACP reductase FabG [Dehalococcoidia bacterium]